jgi:ankyrin repeat protein
MSSLPDHGKAEPRASVHPPSIDSSAGFHERPEPRIRAAIRNPGDCGVEDLKEILETEKSRQCHDYVRLLGLSLLASAEVGNIRTAELVLKLGVHPAALSSRQSPLIRAVHRRNFDVVDLLVKYGAQVDQADRHGMTALMIAALENACNLLELLLRRGADVNRKDNEGKTVLHRLAADQSMNWGVDVLDIVLKTQINVDARDTNGRTALHWACVTDNQMVVERLLTQPTSKRADIGMTDSLLRTPLHLAVARGNCDIVPLLLFHGADINAQSAGGWTPLHIVSNLRRQSESR